jgi:D-cysteine desulfhydrase/L-cysteate sulfo-lyase
MAHAPTALERLDRLSRYLNGPEIWIKRDDCTGLAGGGNKARKLEFLIGEALAAGADTIITAGAIQSNHARQTAAAAARCNLRCLLVLTNTVSGQGPRYRDNGNLLLDEILGAEIHLVNADTESAGEMEALAAHLRGEGRRPFIIPIGGSNAIGALGYVNGFTELHSQCAGNDPAFDHIVMATGSGGTQAGLLLGGLLHNWSGTVLGVSVGSDAARQREKVANVLRGAASLLNVSEKRRDDAPILVDDRFIGPGYGQPASDTLAAIRLTAESEGILLDPVYSGKAMAALIAAIQAGQFRRGQAVVFLHTGGHAALHAYPEHFANRGGSR